MSEIGQPPTSDFILLTSFSIFALRFSICFPPFIFADYGK
jgi:hypothetical protein